MFIFNVLIKAINKMGEILKKHKEQRRIEIISAIGMFLSSFIMVKIMGELCVIGIDRETRLINTIFGIMDIIPSLYIVCTPIIIMVFIPVFIITFYKWCGLYCDEYKPRNKKKWNL